MSFEYDGPSQLIEQHVALRGGRMATLVVPTDLRWSDVALVIQALNAITVDEGPYADLNAIGEVLEEESTAKGLRRTKTGRKSV